MRLFITNRFGSFVLRQLEGKAFDVVPPLATVLWRDTKGFWWQNYRVDFLSTTLQNFTDMANKPGNWGWDHCSVSKSHMPEWIREWDVRHPLKPGQPHVEFRLGYHTGYRFGPDVPPSQHVGIYGPGGQWVCNVTDGAQANRLLGVLSRTKEN